jgi:hypothetical protein
MDATWKWLFEDRKTGRNVYWQWPNPPLWVFLVASVAARLLFRDGTAHTVASVIATLALGVWAVLEIGWGVNPFRRGLGAVVLLLGLLARLR